MAEPTSGPRRRELEGLRLFAQHQIRAARHMGEALASLIPKEARAHSRAAVREWLLSFRALIDEAAGALGGEDAAATGTPSPQRAKKVKVKVEDNEP